MGLPTLIWSAVSIAISIAASLLLAKKQKKPKFDDTPTVTATRGDVIPRCGGVVSIEPLIQKTGDRYWKSEKIPGSGGFLTPSQKQNIYYETQIDFLSVGVGQTIIDIRNSDGDSILLDGPISRNTFTMPSGTPFETTEGTMIVFWGERDQPVSGLAAALNGSASGWPDMFYIIRKDFRMGPSPTSQRLRYIVQIGCDHRILGNSDYWLDGDENKNYLKGINPAHFVAELIYAPRPYGQFVPADLVDRISLEAWGVAAQASGIGVHYNPARGETTAEMVQTICQDHGVTLDEINGKICFTLARDSDPVYALDPDLIESPLVLPTYNFDSTRKSTTRFSYPERKGNFQQHLIDTPKDALDSMYGSRDVREVQIPTVNTRNKARKIAAYRSYENMLTENSLEIVGLRTLRMLPIGTRLYDANAGYFRVASRVPRIGDIPSAEIVLGSDAYGLSQGDALGDGGDDDSADGLPPAIDLFTNFYTVATDTIGIARVRAHQQILTADILAARDAANDPFVLIGYQPGLLAGLKLLDPLAASDTSIARAEDVNGDVTFYTLDLTGDDTSHTNGRQVICIGNELAYCRSVLPLDETFNGSPWQPNATYLAGQSVVAAAYSGRFRFFCVQGGTTAAREPGWGGYTYGQTVNDGTAVWQIRGLLYEVTDLLRGKLGTVPQAASVNDVVAVGERDTLGAFTDPLIESGQSLTLKSVPRTQFSTLDPDLAPEITKTV